ncbi:Bud site selection protein bud4 [Pleurotus ostreatus]|uniref:Bud site selection protein bud4 n=1 Tax=Pleurotus ostreatus TaxID=5322 RepID=A0A8H6ZR01_PLEOS|nr:Bud site selection protein bud4 [Pleurotus ostreatus]KAF7428167.1 Bud site selection protein bud4 [Pleurotus ostreatus]
MCALDLLVPAYRPTCVQKTTGGERNMPPMAGPNHMHDRLFSPSNGLDPIKSSILRESGMGWNSSQTGEGSSEQKPITSPLRIAKRDSPNLRPRVRPPPPGADLPRRTSSSYKHVRSNNLVSKSPFKSQIPTPTPSRPAAVPFPASPRRVSGEKRPRPSSMHDDAENENERPFALKRERKQSKTFQGLLQKEPVTRSPFRRTPSLEEDPLPPPPPPPRVLTDIPNVRSPDPQVEERALPGGVRMLASTSAKSNAASPARSSLVSRRMHGPRVNNPSKRERRKTVTFDERCDVLEFDRHEGESDAFESDEEQGFGQLEDNDDADPFFISSSAPEIEPEMDMHFDEAFHDDAHSYDLNGDLHGPPDSFEEPPKTVDSSYESIALLEDVHEPGLTLDPDSSITGLVDEMFNNVNPGTSNDPVATSTPPSTPPPNLPPDLETEDGIPLGRTHHRDRHHQYKSDHPLPSPPAHEINLLQSQQRRPLPEIDGSHQEYPFSAHLSQFPEPPSTPPRRPSPAQEKSSEGPLGRSTHMERVRLARAEEDRREEYVNRLPASPSPMKTPAKWDHNGDLREGLIPKFNLPSGTPSSSRSVPMQGADPFAVPSLTDEPLPADVNNSVDDALDPNNLSIGHSEVSLNMLDSDLGLAYEDGDSKVSHLDVTKSEMSFGHNNVGELIKDEVLFDASTPDISTPPPPSMLRHRLSSPTLSPSLLDRVASPVGRGSPYQSALQQRAMSPLSRGASPAHVLSNRSSTSSLNSPGSSAGGRTALRPRILRDEVRRRMRGPRPSGSPAMPKASQSEDVESPAADALGTDVSLDNSSHGQHSTPDDQSMGDQSLTDSIISRDDISAADSEGRQSSRDKDRMSVMTDLSAFSVEMATIQTAQRLDVRQSPPQRRDEDVRSQEESRPGPSTAREFGLRVPSAQSTFGLKFDFGSKFGLGGLGIDVGSTSSKGSTSTLKPTSVKMEASSLATRSSRESTTSVRVGDVDVNVDMKSALDRLLDDVGSSGGIGADRVDDSMTTNTTCEDDSQTDISVPTSPPTVKESARPMARAATDSAVFDRAGSLPGSRTASTGSTAPPVPPKDAIRSREELILEKRREARRKEQQMFEGDDSPRPDRYLNVGLGRPSRRRSMSTGDADVLRDNARRRAAAVREGSGTSTLNVQCPEDPLTDSIEQELRKMDKGKKYFVREREEIVYASADVDRVSHMAGPGDVNAGKAWRTVRRPSDMNEYSKQIKEYRTQEKGKAYGKVFVKVLGVKNIHLPLPEQPTAMTCTLNNGIHYVTTPDCKLAQDCRIEQEFELIEHSKLEFTLTIQIRQDPHVKALFKSIFPAAPPLAPVLPSPPPIVQQSSSRDKKRSPPLPPPSQPTPQPQPIQRLNENLARYLKSDGTLARAFISFKDVAPRCDTRIFETSYPLIGQRLELGNKHSTVQVGDIVLQIFRLPPLPGVPQDQLPQSLDECHRGLRYINWHKITYFEGILTQNGGDCSSWRRRQFRVIGGHLVAFNDITKKATATIDLKRAVAIEDDQDTRNGPHSPQSDFDMLGGVERSFRLKFPGDEEIVFFADTDDEKSRWLEVLRALVGHIPPHPLWAELLWQRQEELSKNMNARA